MTRPWSSPSPSPYVPRLAPLRDYGAASFPAGLPVALGALDLMRRIHADFDFQSAQHRGRHAAGPGLRAAQRRVPGLCPPDDRALRMLGLAARYVSGYLLTTPPPGQQALVGADASHAWVQVYVPGHAGCRQRLARARPDQQPGARHRPRAPGLGRDYGDVTPLRGVIRGGGAAHACDVSVAHPLPRTGSGPNVAKSNRIRGAIACMPASTKCACSTRRGARSTTAATNAGCTAQPQRGDARSPRRGGDDLPPRRHHLRRLRRQGRGRRRHRAADPLRPDPARHSRPASGASMEARPAPARDRAQPLHPRRLSRPGDPQGRHRADRAGAEQRAVPARDGAASTCPAASTRTSPASTSCAPPTPTAAAATTCSRTTCACPAA